MMQSCNQNITLKKTLYLLLCKAKEPTKHLPLLKIRNSAFYYHICYVCVNVLLSSFMWNSAKIREKCGNWYYIFYILFTNG